MSYRRPLHTPEEERKRLGLDREGPKWAENSAQLMAQENDKQIENLAHTVGLMKSSMGSLHREINKGDPLLYDIESGMETGQGLLQSNISKITKLTEDGSYRHMCLLVLFTIFVFFLLWWMIR